MTNNVYGIDLGTCNMKIYCKASNKIMNEKNTIALVNKNEMYAYGDDAYAMYEKAPETNSLLLFQQILRTWRSVHFSTCSTRAN